MAGSVITDAHPRLIAAAERVDAAEAMLERAKLEVQEDCEHQIVAHYAKTSRDYCSEPRRICFKCRLEEVGTHWSYDPNGHWRVKEGAALLGKSLSRVVVDLSTNSSAFWALRKI